MRTSHYSVLLALSLFGVGSLVSGPARADNILIQNQLSKWKLGSSPAANPLPVEVRKGDVIEFRVTGPHGVVTIDKPGDQMPAPALDLVLVAARTPVPSQTPCFASSNAVPPASSTRCSPRR